MQSTPNDRGMPGEATHLTASLQAILEDEQGTMRTIPVPLPLAEAIALTGRWYRRERSADSVVRYREEPKRIADAPLASPARCAGCGGQPECLFVRTMAAAEPPAPGTSALCVDCYARANQTGSDAR